MNKLSKSYGEHKVFKDVSLHVEAEQRVAIVGTNGIGKTTLLRCIMGELQTEHGKVKWAENAEVAYMPQDNAAAFEQPVTVFDWMRARGKPRDDDQAIRATLGRMLFSRDEMAKALNMSRRTYFDKIRQSGEFTVNELRFICKRLDFTLRIEPKQARNGVYFNE